MIRLNTILNGNLVDLGLLNGFPPHVSSICIRLMRQIRIVRNRDTNKHTGYAFVVFENEQDMKSMFLQQGPLLIV
jgi:RNA recognition motif-containing protein